MSLFIKPTCAYCCLPLFAGDPLEYAYSTGTEALKTDPTTLGTWGLCSRCCNTANVEPTNEGVLAAYERLCECIEAIGDYHTAGGVAQLATELFAARQNAGVLRAAMERYMIETAARAEEN